MLKVYRHILIEKRMEREMNAFAKTDVGIERAVNQDYVYTKLDNIGCLPNIFVVADGMGGHKAGDMASRYTVDTLIELLKQSAGMDPLDAVDDNIKLLKKAGESEEYEGMGTTLVVASIFGSTLRVANVGDSRLYVIGEDITQITRDHSLVEEMVQLGQIDRKAARTHEKKNYITRAIGGCETVEAEMFSVDLKDNDIIKQIEDMNADIIVVVAYGKILPKRVLEAAKYGCINVHASLLPKYRGAAPIQWSVINGDKETGVTIMQMDEGLDTGDILLVKKTNIDVDETSEELFDRLSLIGADALIESLADIEKGNINPVSQCEKGSSYAQKITKALSSIDWNKTAFEVHNLVRGLQTWPCAQTTLNNKNIKIHKTVLSDIKGGKAGEIIDNNKKLIVSCGDGRCVEILELQPDGKKRMDTKSFLAGNKVTVGTILGE